jgi:hypothetical protein
MHIIHSLPPKEKSKLGYLLVLRWGIWECNEALIAAEMPKRCRKSECCNRNPELAAANIVSSGCKEILRRGEALPQPLAEGSDLGQSFLW